MARKFASSSALLLRELLAQHLADDVHVDLEQRGERADVRDVAQQRAIAIALERLDAHLAERNAEDRDAFANQRVVERPGGIVEQVAAGSHRRDVLGVRLRIQRDDEVDVLGPRRVAVLAHPDLVPGGQSLNVRRKDVLARDGNAHAEDRLHEQTVRARRAGAVHRAHLEGEIIDARSGLLIRHAAPPPCGRRTESRIQTWLMSHAAVGQRSAHRPQWRQTSSSFTMIRFVCGSGAEDVDRLLCD